MEVLTHLNRRIKSNLMIMLPLKDILHYLLSSTQKNILGTNFAIVYLKIALDRVDAKDHIAVLPNLLDGLLKYINERKIFDQLIVLTARAWISIADLNQQIWPSLEPLKINNEKRNVAIMLDSFCDHACMSKNGFLRIAKNVLNDPKVGITALKLSVIKVLSSMVFAEAEILPLLVGAVALGPGEVELAGDVTMRKIDLEKVLRNKDTVNSLFNLYLGLSHQKLEESDKVLPATIPIKLKLMPLLMKSPVAVQTFPYNIR
ncbi:hypothetical protein WUBG_04660, partial [Wuchereria bancrofti]